MNVFSCHQVFIFNMNFSDLEESHRTDPPGFTYALLCFGTYTLFPCFPYYKHCDMLWESTYSPLPEGFYHCNSPGLFRAYSDLPNSRDGCEDLGLCGSCLFLLGARSLPESRFLLWDARRGGLWWGREVCPLLGFSFRNCIEAAYLSFFL